MAVPARLCYPTAPPTHPCIQSHAAHPHLQGNGLSNTACPPVTVAGITTATQVSVTVDFSCARLSSGSVKCWGHDKYGELGDGDAALNPSYSTQHPHSVDAVDVSGITTATKVITGDTRACAILADTSVKCWVSGGSVACGPESCLREAAGLTAACCLCCKLHLAAPSFLLTRNTQLVHPSNQNQGTNWAGELAPGVVGAQSSPVAVPGLTGVVDMVLAYWHTVALLSDGTVAGERSEIGSDLIWSGRCDPNCVGFRLLRRFNRALLCIQSQPLQPIQPRTHHPPVWGQNEAGQLGDGTKTAKTDAYMLMKTAAGATLTGVTAISAGTAKDVYYGEGFTCVLLGDKTVQCCGQRRNGVQGDGTDSSSPRLKLAAISALTDVISLSKSCAVKTGGSVLCW